MCRMSSSVDSSRYQLLKEGYLDVKAPPDSPERVLYKAWRRMWVSATAVLPSGRGEPHLILLVSRHPKPDSSAKQVKASRDGLRLFRCNSGSRPLRTWALASGSTLLVYLAAKTEMETQEWMKAVRDGMWPPIVLPPSLAGTSYEVSLIDDEKSFTSGLLGVYGHLVQTSEDVISVIHPHWQGTQMRWHLCDILDVRLIRTIGKDNIAGVFHLSIRSTSKDKRTLLFYSNTAKIVIEWIRSLLQVRKNSADSIKNTVDVAHHQLPPPSVPTNSTSDITPQEYAIVQKSKENEKLDVTSQTTSNCDTDDAHSDTKPTRNKLNIPNAFLNASITSTMFRDAQTNDSSNPDGGKANDELEDNQEESDDSSADMYEHLYDDLATRRDSRSYTVYEEVNDGGEEEEYVPPMPPSLPKRQLAQQLPTLTSQEPAALRLQKLCESVTEALKQAEETPKEVEHGLQKVKSQKRKKKDGQTSKPSGILSSTKLEAGTAEARVFSDPKETSSKDRDLPFLPFNYRTESDALAENEQHVKEKSNHLPLKDILKSLKVDSAKTSVEKRGNPLQGKVSQTDSLNAKKSASQSEETEAQYLEMS